MRCLVSPRWRQLGPLRAIELPAAAGAPTIVCMHGYGANARDLLPIGMEMDLDGPARWIFPDAPLPLADFGPDSRGWFPIDEQRLADLQANGEGIDISGYRPEGLDDAVQAARALLEALGEPVSRIILGGFSQGAMMAVELSLLAPEPPLGLFLLSGTLVDEPNIKASAPKLKGLKFFQSHGSVDPILDFKLALRLYETLTGAGLEGEFLRFEGPHAVPPEAVEGLRRYLNPIVVGKRP